MDNIQQASAVTIRLDADGLTRAIDAQTSGGYAIQLGEGLGLDDLELVWTRQSISSEGQLLLRLTQGRGELVLARVKQAEERPSAIPGLTGIQLADGQWLSALALEALLANTVQTGRWMEGTSGNDLIRADVWNHVNVFAGAGNDTVVGGVPGFVSTFIGGQGDDTYQLNGLGSRTVIQDQDGANVVRFGPGIRLSELYFWRGDEGTLIVGRYPTSRLEEQGQVSSEQQLQIPTFFTGLAAGAPPVVRFEFEAEGGLVLDAQTVAQRVLTGTDAANILQGGEGAELLSGGGGDDAIHGGMGADTVQGGAGNDTLLGGAGAGSDDVYEGGAGDDLMYDGVRIWGNAGGYSNDTYRFARGDGADVIFDVEGDPYNAVTTQDVLTLGQGITAQDLDVYRVIRSADFVGQYTLSSIVLQVRGTADGVTLLGQAAPGMAGERFGVDEIVFADGTRWDRDAILGRAVNLEARDFTDLGTAGDDTLEATHDRMYLTGDAGNDVYKIDTRPFDTTISDNFNNDSRPGDLNEVQFAAGIRPEDVTVTQLSGGTLLLKHRAGASVTLLYPGTLEQNMWRIAFANGQTWQMADLLSRAVTPTSQISAAPVRDPQQILVGSAGEDSMTGALLRGGKGNDRLVGAGGKSVVLYGRGDGDDVVLPALSVVPWPGNVSYSGTEVVRFDAGIQLDDLLIGFGMVPTGTVTSPETYLRTLISFKGFLGSLDVTSLEAIEFGDGSRVTQAQLVQMAGERFVDRRGDTTPQRIVTGTGNDTVLGGSANDDIQTGAGDDRIHAGAGNDLIDAGSGTNQIEGGYGDDTIRGALGADTITWQPGEGNDVIWLDNADTVRLRGLTQETLVHELGMEGNRITSHALRSFASADALRLMGLEEAGSARFEFYDGTVLSGQQLADSWRTATSVSFVGSDGDDTITGTHGNNSLRGGKGNDSLRGGAGNDVLVGGLGNDTVTCDEGIDYVYFNAGDGRDVVDMDREDALMLPDIDVTKVRVGALGAQSPGTIVLTFDGLPGDSITLVNVSATKGPGGVNGPNGALSWEEVYKRATWTPDQLLQGTSGRDTLTGAEGNDTLNGLGGNDLLVGAAGRDAIDGGTGNDTMRGGLGDDTLVGGKGNDIYQFARGDGRDTIIDTDSTWFNSDVLQLSGAATNQLWFTRSGNNLDIAILGTQDKVTVQDWFKGSSYRVEKITAMDSGKSLTATKVNSLVSAMAGFSLDPATTTQLPANTPGNITRLIASSWA
ncbi:MAG: calcium-binding protein [Aquabacterium sp.]